MAAKSLNMVFLNGAGAKVQINVSNAGQNVTEAQIKTLMDTIISKNIFTSTGGDLKAKQSAAIVEKTSTELAVS